MAEALYLGRIIGDVTGKAIPMCAKCVYDLARWMNAHQRGVTLQVKPLT